VTRRTCDVAVYLRQHVKPGEKIDEIKNVLKQRATQQASTGKDHDRKLNMAISRFKKGNSDTAEIGFKAKKALKDFFLNFGKTGVPGPDKKKRGKRRDGEKEDGGESRQGD